MCCDVSDYFALHLYGIHLSFMLFSAFVSSLSKSDSINEKNHRSTVTQDFVGVMSGWVFDTALLIHIDKGVPVLSAGFAFSRCKFGYTTIDLNFANRNFVGVLPLSKQTGSVHFWLWAQEVNSLFWNSYSGLIPTTQVPEWLQLSGNRPALNQSIFGPGFANKLWHLLT